MTSNKTYGISTEKIELNSIKREVNKKQEVKESSHDSEPVYVNTTLPRGQVSEAYDDADYEILERISGLIQKSQLSPSLEVKDTPKRENRVTLLTYTLLGLVVLLFLTVIGTSVALGLTVSQAKASIGAWSAWEPWTQCSVSCGFGNSHRNRTCVEEQYCVGEQTEYRQCHEATCPVIDGWWSKWAGWGPCSATCNTGIESRQRSCTNPTPSDGGRHCSGESIEYRLCSRMTCAVTDGGWADWSDWTECSSSCIKTRNRTCSNPAPSTNGQICLGNSEDKDNCNLTACGLIPIHGGWTEWTEWGRCSMACSEELVTRQRMCSNPRPINGGDHCFGDAVDYRICWNSTCEVATDCYDIQRKGYGIGNGIYTVRPWRSNRTVTVYCDLTTDGGGWTVFQKRFNGSVDFYRNFANYTLGFGDLSGEFWLGLEIVHEITSKRSTELRIDLTKANGTQGHGVFRNFNISMGPGYNLHTDLGTGTLGYGYNGLYYSTNAAFSTFDHDNDTSYGDCASSYQGGWWYKNCALSNLNGLYFTPGTHSWSSMFYYSFTNDPVSLKDTVMMFRPQF